MGFISGSLHNWGIYVFESFITSNTDLPSDALICFPFSVSSIIISDSILEVNQAKNVGMI